MRCRSVVLPQPEGPTRQTKLAVGNLEIHRGQCSGAAVFGDEGLGDLVNVNHICKSSNRCAALVFNLSGKALAPSVD